MFIPKRNTVLKYAEELLECLKSEVLKIHTLHAGGYAVTDKTSIHFNNVAYKIIVPVIL